ncbi:MAG: DUF1631 family protein [Burkholderiaceae bacterium]
MDNAKQVIQLAKQSALHKFSALMHRMAQDSDNNLVTALSKTAASKDYQKLSAARQFFRQEGNQMLSYMESLFRDQMERAMRTMYTDLRSGLGNFSADTLTLIDDEAVNRQIEVGHLVDRLRDSCDENLGRLNIMIAQVHGKSEVRERENPFRPYLIARTLHDVLRKMVKEEEVAAVLFEYCANSLAVYLPEYYSELCEVFDAEGIKAQLVARPGELTRHQREQLARQVMVSQSIGGVVNSAGSGVNMMPYVMPPNLASNVMPTLQRLLKLMQQQSIQGALDGGARNAGQDAESASQQSDASFQDFVSNLFTRPHNERFGDSFLSNEKNDIRTQGSSAVQGEAKNVQPNLPAELLAKLNEFQQLAARGRGVNEQVKPLQNQLFAVREQINEQVASQPERMSIDLIAVLFEFILDDEQIPEGLRAQIGRLQIPFLKAAMLDPGLLQQTEHPCRQFLNRMGSIAVGLTQDTELNQSVAVEIKRLVRKILDEFDKDMAIFTTCLTELDQFIAEKLRNSDADTALSVEAMEEAEKISGQTVATITSLRDILLPMNVDKRVLDFIVNVWARVMVRASLQAENDPDGASSNSSATKKMCFDVLPELVWSAQNKQSQQDRNALMRLLPTLVKHLKSGLMLLKLSDAESRSALDQLVEVHTEVLRNNDETSMEKLPTLDELRQTFFSLKIQEEPIFSKAVARPQIDSELMEKSLTERGVSVDMDVKPGSTFSSRLDDGWLSQMQIGTRVECMVNQEYQLGRLIWVGKNESLFMFKLDMNSKPLVYSSASLSTALREGKLHLIESAPTFERAVESLLQGTAAVEKRQPEQN